MDKEKEGGERRKENMRERRERSKRRERERERERERGERKKMRFSRCSDGRSSTIREEKSIHASRTMRRYQNIGVSSSSTR